MTSFYFFSLLALVHGNLIIDIDVMTTPPFIDIRNSISTDIISDVERKTFEIQDAQLKKAVANYTNDKEPDFVYVKKTGEENDLYAKHDFVPIKRTVKPKYVDAIIGTPICVNGSDGNIKLSTHWKTNGNILTVLDKITHKVYYDNNKILTIDSDWGVNVFEPNHGTNEEVCTISVTIDYEATIAGDVVADYAKKRTSKDGDHHYYAYDVFNVQKAAGLHQYVVCSEKITITYPKMKGNHISSTTLSTTPAAV